MIRRSEAEISTWAKGCLGIKPQPSMVVLWLQLSGRLGGRGGGASPLFVPREGFMGCRALRSLDFPIVVPIL